MQVSKISMEAIERLFYSKQKKTTKTKKKEEKEETTTMKKEATIYLCNGVICSLSNTSVSAPLSINISTMSTSPNMAAWWSGVKPLGLRLSGGAPRSIKALATWTKVS